jgi:hypothetical protein
MNEKGTYYGHAVMFRGPRTTWMTRSLTSKSDPLLAKCCLLTYEEAHAIGWAMLADGVTLNHGKEYEVRDVKIITKKITYSIDTEKISEKKLPNEVDRIAGGEPK